jgi:hypothetical protein
MAPSNGQTKNSAVSLSAERERQGTSNTEYQNRNHEPGSSAPFKVQGSTFKVNVDNKQLVKEKA